MKAQKNDDHDAKWIAEAASRPTIRFVELKSEEKLDIQSLHRERSRLVAERANLINQLRAILLDHGVILPAGRRKLELGLDSKPAAVRSFGKRNFCKLSVTFGRKPNLRRFLQHGALVPAGLEAYYFNY